VRVSEPLFALTPGDAPLIVSMPHSGTHLPAALAARLSPAARDLPDTDWFVPQLYDFADTLGATVLRATHSRYVVDLNRAPDGAPLYPGRRETTVCPTESFDGEPLYAAGDEPDRDECAARLARYWQPYHARLGTLIRETRARHGHCVLWDAHSILSRVPALFEGRLPDLNLGTADGRSCSAALTRRLAAVLESQAVFSFIVNGRFKGGFITRHYGDPAAQVDAVQLEIAQTAYLAEARVPLYDAAAATPLRGVLRSLLATVTQTPE
jgi:N-formylglutamate deformylase